MTTADMLIDLGHRLEDSDHDRFHVNMKLIALNRAQDRTIMFLNRQLLTEIDVKETQVQVGVDGELDVAGLDNIIRGGANGIDAIYDVGKTKFLQKVSLDEYKDHKNSVRTFLESVPVYYIWGNKLYLIYPPDSLSGTITAFANGGTGLVTVTSAAHGFKTGNSVTIADSSYDGTHTITYLTVDTFNISGTYVATSTGTWTSDGMVEVYYLKKPDGIGGNDPELNSMTHEIIVDLAEADLWNMDNKGERTQAALSRAQSTVNMLNGKYEATESIGGRSPYEIDNDLYASATSVKII